MASNSTRAGSKILTRTHIKGVRAKVDWRQPATEDTARSNGLRRRPVREFRTPENKGNRPSCDNAEGMGLHSLSHIFFVNVQ